MTRFAFYCHNVTGLGHIVRMSQVAKAALAADRECVLLTGCHHLEALGIDPQIVQQRLPAVRPAAGLDFAPVDPHYAGADMIHVRAQMILDHLRQLQPHVILVDHQPLGLRGELLPAVTAACVEGWPTRFVWGIPYLHGSPVRTPKPRNPRVLAAFAHFSSAVAYCDRGEWDEVETLESWAVPTRRTWVGVVAERPLPTLARRRNLIVVLCGGGSTAPALVRGVLAARRAMPEGGSLAVRFVAGPMADPDDLVQVVGDEPQIEICATGTVRDSIRDAAVVVARAGYNTAGCLVQSVLPVVFVPAHGSSGDQLVRAERLAALPGVWNVPDHTVPEIFANVLGQAFARGPVSRRLDGPSDAAQATVGWLAAEAALVVREGAA